MRRGDRSLADGFALLLMLFAVAVSSAAAMAVLPMWTRDIQREKEAELLRIGDLYVRAIESYRDASPGSVKRYPPDLQSLTEDRRFVVLRRHLRKVYADPLTGSATWGTVRDRDGGVVGIYSLSEAAPWRTAATTLRHIELPAAQHYSDWKFMAKLQ